MSNKINHRRKGQCRRSECATLKGWASWGGVQGASRGRRRWKRIRNRTLRRAGRYHGVFNSEELPHE
jgi:hypothetical protein